jgi:hypothetical protein
MQTQVHTFPAHWALPLINGDTSDMTAEELAAMTAHLTRELSPGESIVSDVEDSDRFTWSYRLHGGTADGGTVAEFIGLRP